jgi:polysaccharide chain length determinant protein (PEP-CTERM system associated)
MLPGKKYRPEDFLHILRRRIWVLLVPFAVVSAGTAAVVRKLPDTYRSVALLLVVPQRVPESFVKSTVTTRIEDRLPALAQQILSRTRLEQIIQEFDLYPKERKTGIMEDVVEQMRRDVGFDPKKGDSFSVSYVGPDARTVMKVTERIASTFIDESMKDRANLAEGTDEFLGTTLDDARRRLVEQEKKLEAYRTKFSGQLPSQVDANLQAVQNTMSSIRSTDEALSADRARRLLVEKSLKDLESEAPSPDSAAPATSAATGSSDSPSVGSTAQTLEAAKKVLAALRQRYTNDWPDVRRQQKYVDDLQKKADAEALERPVSVDDPTAGLPPAERARQKRMKVLQDDLNGLDQQSAAREAEEKRLRGVAAGYQARVESSPARESDLVELTRDYGQLSASYNSLLAKKEESKISANLEQRAIGEQFRILDPAQMAEKPFSPNRPQLNLYGIAAGLAIGVGLIVLLEYRDTSFKTDAEVTDLLALPVLAVVPIMQSDDDRRRATKRKVLVGIGLGSTVVGCLAVLVYTFVR